MIRGFALVAALLSTVAAPLAAQDGLSDEDLAVRRLRACLTAGSASAPKDSLLAAVAALRSLCYAQINGVRDIRLGQVDATYGLPEARLSAGRQEDLERARDAAERRLNNEIAQAVSKFTGLTN